MGNIGYYIGEVKVLKKSIIILLLIASLFLSSSCEQLPLQSTESQPVEHSPTITTAPTTEAEPASPKAPLTSEEYSNEVIRIFTALEFADYLQRTLKEAVEPSNGSDIIELPALERIAISYAEESENALNQWSLITPPQEFAEFHNCYLVVLIEQERLSKLLLDVIALNDIEEAKSLISVIGSSEVSPECEEVIKDATEIIFGRPLIIDDTTPQEPMIIPAPLPTPTPTLEPTPSPAPTVPDQTPEKEQPPLNKSNFLVTVNSPYQATITNNSQKTVEVYKFSMEYDFYSYIMYNAPGGGTSYGPIVRSVLTSDESAILQPGQSYPKTFSRKDIVTIVSCSFFIKEVDTGQTLTITYGK